MQSFPASKAMEQVIHAESPSALLSIHPHSGPDMHSFTALSDNVLILDIISPPYDENRQCTYYRETDWAWGKESCASIQAFLTSSDFVEQQHQHQHNDNNHNSTSSFRPFSKLPGQAQGGGGGGGGATDDLCWLIEDPTMQYRKITAPLFFFFFFTCLLHRFQSLKPHLLLLLPFLLTI